MSKLTLKDFQLTNKWELDTEGPKWSDGDPKYIIDMTTGKKYWNESKGCIRIKSFLLALGTPVYHPLASLVNVAWRILKLVTFSHFWMPREDEKSYSFKERLKHAGEDFLRIIATPVGLIGLQLSAIYGIASPYDGRKLYATIEIALYETFVMAPCFQPRATSHFFGGDPEKRNAF